MITRTALSWAIAALTVWTLMGLNAARDERDAEATLADCRALNVALFDVGLSALDGYTTCEGVLATCARVIGGEAMCSCWLDEDGGVR